MFDYKNYEIVTLGPQGTDASYVAMQLSKYIVLCDSFEKAMYYAYQHNSLALICCGYISKENKDIIDSWVNLNFSYYEKMSIISCFYHNTKKMCIAINKDTEKIKSMVIHPSTEVFTSRIDYKGPLFYVNNKPEAVCLVAEHKYDACIGSYDIVQGYDNLKIIDIFTPQMVWAIYAGNEHPLNQKNLFTVNMEDIS